MTHSDAVKAVALCEFTLIQCVRASLPDMQVFHLLHRAAGRVRSDFIALPARRFALASIGGCLTLLLYARWASGIFAFPADVADASTTDFIAYWVAARETLSGHLASIYDPAAYVAALPPQGEGLLWLFPPHAMIMFLPLGLMDYGTARLVWMCASLFAFAGAALIAARSNRWLLIAFLASPAVYANFYMSQAAAFFAFFLVGGLYWSKSRPILAGLLIAALTIKPQYGLMIPVFLAAVGAWRAFGVAAAGTVALAAVSVIAFGVTPWGAFAHALTTVHATFISLDNSAMYTVFRITENFGGSALTGWVLQVSAIMAAALAVWFVTTRLPFREAVAFTLLATAISSPYFWFYDWAVPALAVMMILSTHRKFSFTEEYTLVFIWLVPIMIFINHDSRLGFIPTVLIIISAALVYKNIFHNNLITSRTKQTTT